MQVTSILLWPNPNFLVLTVLPVFPPRTVLKSLSTAFTAEQNLVEQHGYYRTLAVCTVKKVRNPIRHVKISFACANPHRNVYLTLAIENTDRQLHRTRKGTFHNVPCRFVAGTLDLRRDNLRCLLP